MRITSGILGGRAFNVPKNGMRPTKEQVREAVFSSLAARISGARVLDLFAGAGSYGLEAWSRGARSVTAVEKVSKHWKNLQENFQGLEPIASGHGASRRKGDSSFQTLENVGLGNWQVVQSDVFDFLKRGSGRFDLIFADPPYDEADLPKLLEAVSGTLAPGGLLVFEMRSSDPYSVSPKWNLIKEKKYGETRILFLEKAE